MEGTSEFINQLNCFHGDSFHVYHWGEGPILPKLVSDSCGARGTEAPGKVAEEKWSGGGWLFFLSIQIPGLGGSITGMAERAQREEVGAGSACLPIMWEDFGLQLLIPE